MALDRSPWHKGVGAQEFVAVLPAFAFVNILRAKYYASLLHACGPDLDVSSGVLIDYPERVTFGARVFLNRGVYITAHAPITVGDDVLMGPYVVINSGDHVYDVPHVPIRRQGHRVSPIDIGRDVWLGAGAIVLRGVTIGEGSVVAAGSVVNADVEPYTVVAGTPARLVSHRPPRTRRS